MRLEEVTLETFAPHVGSIFTLAAGSAAVPLELVEATALPAPPGDMGRPPFSLEFAGPADPMQPQATVELTHAALGTLQIFIVPIARDAEHTRYQAIFT